MKRILGLVAVMVLGSAAPSPALLGPEKSVGIRVGSGSFQSDSVFGSTTDIESPIVLGATAGMRQGHLGAEISLDRITVDLKTSSKWAELTMMPILLTAQFHPTENDAPFDLYFGAGVGYYLNSASASSGASGSKVEADDSVGFHLAVGANMKVSSVVAFVVDARYALTSTDLTLKGGGTSTSDSINLNGLVVTAGLKYFFPK